MSVTLGRIPAVSSVGSGSALGTRKETEVNPGVLLAFFSVDLSSISAKLLSVML